MHRRYVYAKDEETAVKIREKIQSLPNHLMEELKTEHNGFKFEFFGTMLDGIELMGLGASSFGEL